MKERSPQRTRYGNLIRHVDNYGLFLKNKLGISKPDTLEFTLKNDVKVRVPRSRLVEFKCIVMDDCYLKGFHLDKLVPRRKMTICDIGANLGFCSLYLKSRFPNSVIYCFEPLDVNFQYLRTNLELNPDREIVPIHAGVASERGTITLYSGCDDDFPTDSSSIRANGAGTLFTVDTVRLEDVIDEYRIAKIDLLKVDCEGAEYDIFYNSRQGVFDIVDNIVMDVHGGAGENENIEAICAHLQELGFFYCVAEDSLFLWASKDKARLKEVTAT